MTQKVKLVSVTSPRGIPQVETPEAFIAYTARVSNPSNQTNTDTALKLVKYLIKHKHWSPFEMVSVGMEINTTRDIARQILRHRSFSFQEFSQRYADVNSLGDLFTEPRECRLQDDKNRQNSIETSSEDLVREFYDTQREVMDLVSNRYEYLLHAGIAKEQARAILPEGLTKSRLYMNGSLRSWIHFCELRMGNGTQKEHREIAKECWEVLRKEFPSVIGALEELNNNG